MSSNSNSTPARSNPQTGSGKSQTTASTASKWGSFFQGAVAGLESRLDNILAEDGGSGGVDGECSGPGKVGKEDKNGSGDRNGNIETGSGVRVSSATASASVSRSGSVRAGEKGGRQGGF